MAVVIGFATTVGDAFAAACATSVNWGMQPNVQRLYCLGPPPTARYNIERPTENLSISVYQETGGPTNHNVTASTDCDDLSSISASVSPGSCGTVVDGVSGDWYVTSYNYSKDDPLLPGTETWTMTRWIAGADSLLSPAPSHYIRTVAEAQATLSPGGPCGITFDGNYAILEGRTGSVSAGGVGRANDLFHGVATSVGGATAGGGEIESGSSNCPVTPLWI